MAATGQRQAGCTVDKAAIYGHINVADEAEQRRHHSSNGGGRRCSSSSSRVVGDGTANDDAIESVPKTTTTTTPDDIVSCRGRNKFSGSLPNHLDAVEDDVVVVANDAAEGCARTRTTTNSRVCYTDATASASTNDGDSSRPPANVEGRSICCWWRAEQAARIGW